MIIRDSIPGVDGGGACRGPVSFCTLRDRERVDSANGPLGLREADELTQLKAVAVWIADFSQAHRHATTGIAQLPNRATGCLQLLHGGVQIVVYPMKKERYEALVEEQRFDRFGCASFASGSSEWDMGLAPGGRMQQEIYDDPYGLDAWDQRHSSRCFVTIANSAVWTAVTGERPPTEPPTAKEYKGRRPVHFINS